MCGKCLLLPTVFTFQIPLTLLTSSGLFPMYSFSAWTLLVSQREAQSPLGLQWKWRLPSIYSTLMLWGSSGELSIFSLCGIVLNKVRHNLQLFLISRWCCCWFVHMSIQLSIPTFRGKNDNMIMLAVYMSTKLDPFCLPFSSYCCLLSKQLAAKFFITTSVEYPKENSVLAIQRPWVNESQ